MSTVKTPALVLTGGNTGAWADDAAEALTRALPNPQHRILQGQDHAVAWDALAPALKEYFGTGLVDP